MTTIKKTNVPKGQRNNTKIGDGSTIIVQGGATTPVVDNLNSNSPTSALSARQGKVLNDTKLSSINKDTAKEQITFDRGLISNMDIRAGGFSPDNTSIGASIYQNINDWNVIADKLIARKEIATADYTTENGAAIFKDTDGVWNAVVDNLKVRKNFHVNTLEVEETKYIGNNIICSQAGFKCIKVEEVRTSGEKAYRCYFNNKEDNITVPNKFKVGDFVYCAMFDGKNGRTWWRMCIAVGADFIDVSTLNCMTGSDVPMVGDNIIQLGNVSEEKRQRALVLWTDGLCMYEGINDYTIPTPTVELTSSGIRVNKVTANVGNIGRFTITDKGLENDVDVEGVGVLDLSDKKNDVSFRVGGDKKYLNNTCYIKNNYSTNEGIIANALTCECTTGNGIVARGGREGFGINVEGGAKIRGLYYNCKVIGDSFMTEITDPKYNGGKPIKVYEVKEDDDILVIPTTITDKRFWIKLPIPRLSKGGKEIRIVNPNGDIYIYLDGSNTLLDRTGSIINSQTGTDARVNGGGRTSSFITTGINWFKIIY